MPSILWITHRELSSDLTKTSRLGIASELEKNGHTVTWVSPTRTMGHFVFRSPRLGFGHSTFTRNLRKFLPTITSPDIAIVEWTAVEGAFQELNRRSIPWILMDRSPPTSRGFARVIQNRQYKKAWDISREFSIGAAVKSDFHVDSSDTFPQIVIPGGVDCSLFDPHHSDRESPVLVYLGSISKVRELERLVHMGLEISFIGSGDAVERMRLLGARVENPCSFEEVPSVLSKGDIGLLHLPNRSEWKGASPLKVSEYAASGMCVISSDVSGLSEFIDEEWLTLIPLGDDLKFHSAVLDLIELGMDEIRRRGDLARQWAIKNRDWSVCVSDFEKFIVKSLHQG